MGILGSREPRDLIISSLAYFFFIFFFNFYIDDA